MEIQPQMFFVRSCAELLPPWLKTPIPGLHILDRKIPYLSLLDKPIRVSGLLSEVEVDESDYDDDFEDDFDDIDDDFDEIIAEEEETDLELLFVEVPEVLEHEVALEEPSVLFDSQTDYETVKGSFYIEGQVRQGTSSEYSVNGSDFVVDQTTVVSGDLLCGTYAAVQGVVLADGTKLATIIVSDLRA